VGKLFISQKLTVCVFLFFQRSMKFTFFYAWEASDTRVMSVSFYVNKPLTPVKAVTSRFFFNLHTLWNNRTAPYLWENGKERLGISRYTSYNMLNRWTNYHCGYSHKVAHCLIHFVNINKHNLFDDNRLFSRTSIPITRSKRRNHHKDSKLHLRYTNRKCIVKNVS